MKKPKLNKLKTVIVVEALIICLLITTLAYVYAQSTTIFTISQGLFPGAPNYTIWREGSTYYAKSAYGIIDYFGIDASTVIQGTINALSSGGKIFFASAIYVLPRLIVLKANIKIEGQGSGETGTIFRAQTGFTNSSLFRINAVSDTVVKNICFSHLRIDGNGENVVGLNLTNIGNGYFEEIAVVDCDVCLLVDFYGTIPPSGSTVPGGVTLSSCRFRPNTNENCLTFRYATQCWIQNCWFVSGSNVTINIFDCNKIHGQNNELNDCYYGVLITDDDNPSSHTINFDNNHIDVTSSGYAVYVEITTPDPYDAIRFTDTYIVGNDIDTIHVNAASQVVFEGSSIANRVFHDFNIASVGNGADSITITHYVVGTPTSIVVTPMWAAGGCYITLRNATKFVVDWANNPTGDTYLFWEANYQP